MPQRIGTHAEHWEVRARSLAHSAEVLLPVRSSIGNIKPRTAEIRYLQSKSSVGADISSSSIAFMLAGFALENVLTGIRIHQINSESPAIKDEVRVRSITKTHDLQQLAQEARVNTSDDDLKVLAKLTEQILWAGKDPRPKGAADFLKVWRWGERRTTLLWTTPSRACIKAVLWRLYARWRSEGPGFFAGICPGLLLCGVSHQSSLLTQRRPVDGALATRACSPRPNTHPFERSQINAR